MTWGSMVRRIGIQNHRLRHQSCPLKSGKTSRFLDPFGSTVQTPETASLRRTSGVPLRRPVTAHPSRTASAPAGLGFGRAHLPRPLPHATEVQGGDGRAATAAYQRHMLSDSASCSAPMFSLKTTCVRSISFRGNLHPAAPHVHRPAGR